MTEPRLRARDLAAATTLAQPRLDHTAHRVAWIAADADGVRITVAPVDGGDARVITEPTPALRGGTIEWLDDDHLVIAAMAGGVWLVPLDGPSVLLADENAGCSGVAVSPTGDGVAYVVDQRAVKVVPAAGGTAVTVADTAHFALDPQWSPDGERLAWHCWDVPHMPWDRSRIVVAPAAPNAPVVTVAGGAVLHQAPSQPLWLADGRLGWLDDRDGLRVPWVADGDGTGARAVLEDPAHEHGGPAWGSGIRSWAVSPDAVWLAADRNEEGFGRLVVHRISNGEGVSVGKAVHTDIGWRANRIVALRSGARTPTQLVVYDMDDLEEKVEEVAALATDHASLMEMADQPERTPDRIREILRGSALRAAMVGLARPAHRSLVAASSGLDAGFLPEPEVIRFSIDGQMAIGRLYVPVDGEAPHRCVVWSHGGPHDQLRVEWKHRLAFLIDRGWAVLTVDHRGTTGHGREWALALHGRWGEVDVADTVAAVSSLVDRGQLDPRRIVAAGSSAGGFTTLLLLVHHPELFTAGVALYPVADLAGLSESTHRFEAHYNESLVGPLAGHADTYAERSPITHAGRIRGPLLLLHGDADDVVPVSQARSLEERIRAAGGEVDLTVYAGQGHGWHDPGVIEDELARIGAFLDRIGGTR